MNMLDDVVKDFYPTHEINFHLSQIEWDAVERLSTTIGQEAIGAMLPALGSDGQHATIAKSIQNELDAERVKVALLHEQGSQHTELLKEQSTQQFELLIQQQATASETTHTRRPESLKTDISKYKGAKEVSLLRWFVEMDDAIRNRLLVYEQMQVAIA